MSTLNLRRLVLSLFVVPLCAAGASAQGDAQDSGLTREQMWRAPTAEEWAQPCLLRFQRTWEDAVAVSKETGKAILVCVNMDGEIASEHYAGVRYRDPEIALLYQPYVCVIASVYRHTPRDHDEEGNRILCPRFGSVTCGEHIAIEPGLFDEYFDGQRVAPRHVMVELDGAETYDVYYAFDTAGVFRRIREGIENRENQPDEIVRGDRPIEERVASRDIEDREATEEAYRTGTREVRVKLMRRAVQAGDAASADLLRMAVFGFDVELSKMAREALAKANSPNAIGLINEALRVPMETEEREALIAALERIGEQDPQAKTLALVHRGLSLRSDTVDADVWARELEGAEAVQTEFTVLESRMQYVTAASQSKDTDPEAQLELAEASLAIAVDPETARVLSEDPRTRADYARLMFEDAQRAARRAEELGATGWRLDAVVALSGYYLGDRETAYARAIAAMPSIPAGDESWNAMATIALFAEARREAIRTAVRAKEEWPKEWLTDVNDAYAILARHPQGTDYQVAAHNDFLWRLGAGGRATTVLDEGLKRFPESALLHTRLRGRILGQKGHAGLEPTYAAMLASADATPNLVWFAGYASMVAAEYYRRENAPAESWEAYGRAIEFYRRATETNPASRDSSDHYIAMAHAGRARCALDRRMEEDALTEILAAFERREASAADLDGMNLSAVATAKTLLNRLEEQDELELAARLRTALDALDPKLLELPAFEGASRAGAGRGRGRSGGTGAR